MDLTELDTSSAADEGVEMAVRHPVTNAPLMMADGETPITIRVAGMDSKIFRKAQRANQDRRMKGARYRAPTADELDAEATELVAKCTLSWRGVMIDGAELQCSFANAKQLYTRLPWLREQVDLFMGDRANFLQTPATS